MINGKDLIMGNLVLSSFLLLFAIVVATGKLDFIFVNYGPGYVDGKFKWFKRTKYKARSSRYMLVALLLLVTAILLSVEFLGFDKVLAAVIIAVMAVVVCVISFRLIERE